MRVFGFCVACLFAVVRGVYAAIPTAAECEAVADKIDELTAGDYAALKAGKKNHAETGDALLGYVTQDDKTAVKFVLCQKAYEQYVLGKAFDKADGVYGAVQSEEGTEYAQAVVQPIALKLSGFATSRNPEAKTLKARIENDGKSLKRVNAVKAQIRKDPGDLTLSEKLGVEYAAIGEWEGALASFATAEGEIAKIAAWELSETRGTDYTADKVAAFWWGYADRYAKQKRVACQFKSHAAMWYQTAIGEGLYKGIDEKLAQKRIDEVRSTIDAEEKSGRPVAVGRRNVNIPGLAVHFGFDGNLREDVGKVAWEASEKVKWCTDHRGRPMSAIHLDGETTLANEKSFTEIEKQMTIVAWLKPEGRIERFIRQSGRGKDGCGIGGPAAILAVNYYNNGHQAEQGLFVGENGLMLVEHGGNHLPATIVYEKTIGKKWIHVVVVIKEGKKPILYLDGRQVAEGDVSPRLPMLRFGKGPEDSGANMNVSILGDKGYGGMRPFVGAIADLAVYKRILTPEEIMRLYQN